MKKAVVIFSFLTLWSCSTNKKVVDNSPIPEINNQQLVEILSKNNFQFDWFVSKAKLKVKSPEESFSGKLYFRMKRDSIIWAVIKKYSAEAIRTLITHDSIYTLDRLNTKYSIQPYTKIDQVTNIDLSFIDMQDYLFGNIDIDSSNIINIQIINRKYVANITKEGIDLIFTIDPRSHHIDKVLYKREDGSTTEILLSKYKQRESIFVPFEREILIVDQLGQQSRIRMEFSEIEIDKPKVTRFSIPEHYERIDG